ncbi:hypothetical protein TNCV_2013811 [Trichonephila clavipes]|nr:hypothetical protein TNCV_2013811 [Trichonephila clavipes]
MRTSNTHDFHPPPPLSPAVEIGVVAIYRKEVQPVSQALETLIPSHRNFTERNGTVTCMVLKAKVNNRRTSSPFPR